ncbi:MAG: hypothetical protein ACKOXT_02435 [Actinomycetota bacterium]
MKWSLFGSRPSNPAPAWTGLVLAFVFAAQTFIDNSAGYPAPMIWLALAASLGFLILGIRSKAFLGFAFIPAGSLFLLPAIGVDDFSTPSVAMFMAHSLLAVLFAISSYTFLARERKEK